MITLNGTLFVQFLNFFILVAILAKFAYKPILRVMEERRQKIANDLASAEEARIAAEHLQEEYKQQIVKAHQEAKEIVDRAMKNAEELAQARLEELRAQIAREQENARKEISLERDRVLAEIRQEVVGISMAVAGKVIRKELSEKDNEMFIHEAIDKLNGQSVGLQ